MNLYEHEGKALFKTYTINTPRSVLIHRGDKVQEIYQSFGIKHVVIKAQVLSGKRGKNNGILFCDNVDEVVNAVDVLFSKEVNNQYVATILMEEKIDIKEEQYLSISYDTSTRSPVCLYSKKGGMDIEDVDDKDISKNILNVTQKKVVIKDAPKKVQDIANKLYNCFLQEDVRSIEINPLVLTKDEDWVAADAKVALDDDAMYRHKERQYPPRSMMGRPPTKREVDAARIDSGEKYYRGTASKYIELDGDVGVMFSGGGASIAAMDALLHAGLFPANYTEYSGNPPREKVYKLTKVVLSKPNIKALWITGAVANSTDIAETFKGIIEALDEANWKKPIVIRRAGPNDKEAMKCMQACADRNGFELHMSGKEVGIDDTVDILKNLIG